MEQLAGLREQSEALTRKRVQLQQDISAARQQVAAAKDTSRQGGCSMPFHGRLLDTWATACHPACCLSLNQQC